MIIKVAGMSCVHCKHSIESALGQLDSVNKVTAYPEKGIVEIGCQGLLDAEIIAKTIEDAGFEFVEILG